MRPTNQASNSADARRAPLLLCIHTLTLVTVSLTLQPIYRRAHGGYLLKAARRACAPGGVRAHRRI